MKTAYRLRLLLVAGAFVPLVACQMENSAPAGPTQQTSAEVGLGGAQSARIELNMGAGEMNVRGGAGKLVDAHFEFNVPGSEPKIDSSTSGSEAIVNISQPKDIHFGGNRHYVWNIDLNNEVPLDLQLHCGAGQAKLDLGDLNLRSVDTQMGAGQVDLDLRGKPAHDYYVNISGGVGQATVRLPSDVGIRAEASGGLGSLSVTGLQKKDDHWENDLWEKGKANVRLKVQGGIGEIRIIG